MLVHQQSTPAPVQPMTRAAAHGPALALQLLPETDPAFLRPFLVEGVLAVRALLRELVTHRALLAIYAGHELEDFVISQVTHLDDHSIELDFVTDDDRRQAIARAGGVVVIGLLETVKVQFELSPIGLDLRDGRPVLRARHPQTMYRIQRRDAFRVRPPAGEPASVVIRLSPGAEQHFRVIDFSATGVAYAMAPGSALPLEGTVLHLSRLECAGRPPIPCDLLVRHVSAGLLSENGAHRIGCEFYRIDSLAERAVQMIVIDLERRQRQAITRG